MHTWKERCPLEFRKYHNQICWVNVNAIGNKSGSIFEYVEMDLQNKHMQNLCQINPLWTNEFDWLAAEQYAKPIEHTLDDWWLAKWMKLHEIWIWPMCKCQCFVFVWSLFRKNHTLSTLNFWPLYCVCSLFTTIHPFCLTLKFKYKHTPFHLFIITYRTVFTHKLSYNVRNCCVPMCGVGVWFS